MPRLWRPSSSRRRGGLGGRCSLCETAVFSGKEPELFARFSRKGCWVLKNKKPTSGWKWASDAGARCSSVFPLPVRDGGAFRHSYLGNLPGGDGLLRARKTSLAAQMERLGGRVVHGAVHGSRYMREVCQQCVVTKTDRNKPVFVQGLRESFFRAARF